MFRRDARNKLRNMGGIMASSEPLIQEVAKYQLGGGVNIMTQPTNQIPVIIGGSPRKKSYQEKISICFRSNFKFSNKKNSQYKYQGYSVWI